MVNLKNEKMKKIMLTALVAVITMVSVNAQTFGTKVGLNVANLSGSVTNNKALIGFNLGVFAEITLADSFYLQPELLYSTQGVKYDNSEANLSADVNLNYINLPIMFKYDVANRFYLEAGPQIGFLVLGKVLDQDAKDQFESIDFGANFGLSYGFTDKIFAQARYNLGLSNIIKDSSLESSENSVLSFSLGYKF